MHWIWLAALTLLFATELSILSMYGENVPRDTEWLWGFCMALTLASWVYADRRAKNFAAPYEFEAFVFFMWPVAVPYYLYRTRGVRGLVIGAGLWGLYAAPFLVAYLVYLVASFDW